MTGPARHGGFLRKASALAPKLQFNDFFNEIRQKGKFGELRRISSCEPDSLILSRPVAQNTDDGHRGKKARRSRDNYPSRLRHPKPNRYR
jgi:hypothetical protein